MADDYREFSTQLESLFAAAARDGGALPAAGVRPADANGRRAPADAEHVAAPPWRPVLHGLQALVRMAGDNSRTLANIEVAAAKQADGLAALGSLKEAVDSRNDATQRLFDALYEELKSYKEGFLVDLFHKPVIRDLIALADDLGTLHRQMTALLGGAGPADGGGAAARPAADSELVAICDQIGHGVHAVLEMLARLGVERLACDGRKLDRERQRAVAVEPTAHRAEEADVIRVVRPGFIWRQRTIRPEEVVIKKYDNGSPAAADQDRQPAAAPPP